MVIAISCPRLPPPIVWHFVILCRTRNLYGGTKFYLTKYYLFDFTDIGCLMSHIALPLKAMELSSRLIFFNRLSEKCLVLLAKTTAASRPNIFYPEIHVVDLW